MKFRFVFVFCDGENQRKNLYRYPKIPFTTIVLLQRSIGRKSQTDGNERMLFAFLIILLFANGKIVIFVFNASVFHRFQCFRRKSKNNRLIAMMFMRFSIFCHVYKLVFILVFAHTIALWMTRFYRPNFSVQKFKIVLVVFDYN